MLQPRRAPPDRPGTSNGGASSPTSVQETQLRALSARSGRIPECREVRPAAPRSTSERWAPERSRQGRVLWKTRRSESQVSKLADNVPTLNVPDCTSVCVWGDLLGLLGRPENGYKGGSTCTLNKGSDCASPGHTNPALQPELTPHLHPSHQRSPNRRGPRMATSGSSKHTLPAARVCVEGGARVTCVSPGTVFGDQPAWCVSRSPNLPPTAPE